MKAVITDLDRTLLRTDKTLSEYTIDIMRQCHAKNIAVIAATARPERSILTYRELIHFDAVITLNGARSILPDTVLENGISHSSGKCILSRLISIPDILISMETSQGLYSNTAIPEWEPMVFDGFPELPPRTVLYKILASSKSNILYDRIESVLTEDTYHTLADNDLVQIMSKNATKWKGIKAVLQALDISPGEAIYFGDDNDDIEPIRMCGMGVAVSNAIEAVLKEADHITGCNDEDGVAHFLASAITSNLCRES